MSLQDGQFTKQTAFELLKLYLTTLHILETKPTKEITNRIHPLVEQVSIQMKNKTQPQKILIDTDLLKIIGKTVADNANNKTINALLKTQSEGIQEIVQQWRLDKMRENFAPLSTLHETQTLDLLKQFKTNLCNNIKANPEYQRLSHTEFYGVIVKETQGLLEKENSNNKKIISEKLSWEYFYTLLTNRREYLGMDADAAFSKAQNASKNKFTQESYRQSLVTISENSMFELILDGAWWWNKPIDPAPSMRMYCILKDPSQLFTKNENGETKLQTFIKNLKNVDFKGDYKISGNLKELLTKEDRFVFYSDDPREFAKAQQVIQGLFLDTHFNYGITPSVIPKINENGQLTESNKDLSYNALLAHYLYAHAQVAAGNKNYQRVLDFKLTPGAASYIEEVNNSVEELRNAVEPPETNIWMPEPKPLPEIGDLG